LAKGAVGCTTTTDPRSQRNRAGRRGGQLPTRARSSSNTSACPRFMLPAPRSPDGRTIREDRDLAGLGSATSIMPVTNLLERLNEAIKRRTHVVRIFPNVESCLRLIRALAVEMHENWLEAHRYLNMDDLREHKKEALRMAA
jgi:putative transposase